MTQEKSVDMAAMQADYEANMSMWRLPSTIEDLAEEIHGIQEQLRVSNLLKLCGDLTAPASSSLEGKARKRLFTSDSTGHWIETIKPEFSEILGIEQEDKS